MVSNDELTNAVDNKAIREDIFTVCGLSLRNILQIFAKYSIKYVSLRNDISKNFKGRICHHRVVVLNILANIINAETYLEVGVHNGTSMAYAAHERPNMKCIGVDLFENTIDRYSHDDLQMSRTLEQHFARNRRKGQHCSHKRRLERQGSY